MVRAGVGWGEDDAGTLRCPEPDVPASRVPRAVRADAGLAARCPLLAGGGIRTQALRGRAGQAAQVPGGRKFGAGAAPAARGMRSGPARSGRCWAPLPPGSRSGDPGAFVLPP